MKEEDMDGGWVEDEKKRETERDEINKLDVWHKTDTIVDF